MASSTAWKELLLKKKKTNKDALIDDSDEYFRFCKISGGQRHHSALLSKFIYQLIESEKVYNETLDTALNACMHLSDIKNVGFEEFLERLTLLRNSCQEILASMQKKNDEKVFINYITSASFYKIYQDYVSHFNSDFVKIQKAKNENSRLQIQLKDVDLYLNAPFRRVFFYRAIYWNILRCKNQKTKIGDNKIIHSLNSLVNSILKCKEELQIENDDFIKIAKFEQDLDSSKVNVNGETMSIFTYLCTGINTSPIENTPNIINTYNLEKITINNSDYEKSAKDNVTVTVFSDFLIITKDIQQKSNKDNLKSQLLYPPIPLKEVSITEREVPRHLQKFNHLDNGFDSIKLKNEDTNSLNYTDFIFELRCTNPQIFIVLQAENDEDRETFINSIIMQRNYILNDNHEISFDSLGQVVVSSTKPKAPQINIERNNSLSIRGIKAGENFSNMSIDMDNSIIDGSENNDNVDLGLSEKNESITNDDSSKFNNTTIFQAICSPYYFKQNEWIKMPKSIFCINQNSDGRNFITLNASATGRILLNEYICPDSVIKQSSKNDNVIQIKTKSRGLFSIRFSKYDTAAFNTLLNFSKDLIRDSIVWTYENKDELFLIEKSPSLDETYGLVIKNNIDDSTDSFKVYCEKTTKYEIIDQLYVKEENNWISLGLSKINIVIPNYIMENNIENSENPEEMEFLSQNSIEPIITAHSLTDIKKPGSTQSSIMCFLRAPINQDCIILKNKNIHDDNVYELNFMFDEKIYEYMIYSKKTDNSLAFVSEYINKLSNFYSKIEEEKYDPELFANSDILAENTEESISEGQNSPIDNVSNKDEEEEEVKNDDEINNDASSTSQSSVSNKNSENNLLAGFTFMTTSDKPPLADQNTQDSQNSPIKNQFVFDLGDFSSNNNTVESEKNKNSTSIFSGFTLSTPTKENTSTKDEANDNLSSPLFANKPKFVVPTLNTNSFGFAFNTSSTQKDTTTPTTNSLFGNSTTTPTTNSLFGNSTITPTTNSLFGNSTITPTTNSLFGNSTTTPTANPLFGNKTTTATDTKPGLFGNTTNTLAFGNVGSFGFNFSSSKNQTNTQNSDSVSNENTSNAEKNNVEVTEVVEKKEVEEVAEVVEKKKVEEVAEVVEKKEEEEVAEVVEKKEEEEVAEVVEKKEEEEVAEVVEKKEEEEVAEVVEKKEVEEVAEVVEEKEVEEVAEVVEKKEVEEVAEVVEKDGEEKETEIIEKNNNQEEIVENETNDSEKKEIEKSNFKDEISEIKKQNHEKYNYPEVDTSLSGTLFDVSEPYNEVTNEGKLSKLNDNNFVDDIMDMKNGKLSSFNYNHFVRSCNDLFIGANNIEVPIREFSINMNTSTKDIMKDSIANLKFEINKIRSIFNDSDASIITYYDENSQKSNESLNAKTNINKTKSITELEMKTIMNDYIVKKTETEENKILSVQRYIDKYKSSINNLNEKVSNEEPKAIITEECENKSSRVADIVSNINNIINNNNQPVIKKENHISQNYVDKMTKEFTMKGLNNSNNNNNQTFEKGKKVKCLRLSPSVDENMTTEELLSVYKKSLRPVKRPENKLENENFSKDRYKLNEKRASSSIITTNNDSIASNNDSITSYYKYVENGKIEMASTGNMNINEAFDLLRYKIKILRKQLEIERRAREDITEDYMALKNELNDLMEKSEIINESFILERDAGMEKDDYIQLLEEKIKIYEALIQRHNEAYPDDNIPNVNNEDILELISNSQIISETDSLNQAKIN